MAVRMPFQYFTMTTDKSISSDPAPKDMYVGAVSPYALVSALLGQRIDPNSIESVQIISDALQTDYNELFDMKYNSVLYAGLRLNKDNYAEPLSSRDMHELTEDDLETPNLSKIEKVSDLQDIGLKDIPDTQVKQAWFRNGKLNLILHPRHLAAKLSNSDVTRSISELVTPFRRQKQESTPPNSTWRNVFDFLKERTDNNDPVQGAIGNSYLIAAISAVSWADPYTIIHRTRATGHSERTKIHFHSKGGRNDARSADVEVNDDIIINNSSNFPVYCRSSEGGDLYPSLYEKAFAKWITQDSSHHPDITQTAAGDPVKVMAQINNKTPYYYFTSRHSAEDLLGVARSNSVNKKTINPMIAWTHGSGEMYRGSNLVGNHAYTILGWFSLGGKQYFVLRNPWGVTEPMGLNTYPGLMAVHHRIWRPINKIDSNGIFAMEAEAFKRCFAGLGVAK